MGGSHRYVETPNAPPAFIPGEIKGGPAIIADICDVDGARDLDAVGVGVTFCLPELHTL